jgi:ATP-dependent Lhr-like helicase
MHHALVDCARRGDLDDIHEYDRPSVRFQQVLSQAWYATRNEDGLVPVDLPRRTGGHQHAAVISDMISTGALIRNRGVVFPNDKLIEEGDERRIHSVLLGGGGLPVLDARTGDTLTQVANRAQAGGRMFVGGGFRQLSGARQGPLHLEKVSGPRERRLAMLPKTRGFGGLSRPLVWAMTRRIGLDPTVWIWVGGRWTTNGGGAFNRMLAAILGHRFAPDVWRADDFGVDGPDPGAMRPPPVSLSELVAATVAALDHPNALSSVAAKLAQPSKYRNNLSAELRMAEARAGLPVPGFLRWIAECRLECKIALNDDAASARH